MKLTRQIGFMIAQAKYVSEENILSDINDLDYLRNVEKRLRDLVSKLHSKGLITKDPLSELKNHFEYIARIHLLSDEIFNPAKSISKWLKTSMYVSVDINRYNSQLSKIQKELPSKVSELHEIMNYCRSVEVFDQALVVCPYIKGYSMFVDEDFGGADEDGDGILSQEEIIAHKSKPLKLKVVLQEVLDNPNGFLKKQLDILNQLKSQTALITSEYVRLSNELKLTDSKLENGRIHEVEKLLAVSKPYPEIANNISSKFTSTYEINKKIFDLTNKIKCYLKNRKVPLILFGKKHKNEDYNLEKIKVVIDDFQKSYNQISSHRLSLPHGLADSLSDSQSGLSAEITSLENHYSKLKKVYLRSMLGLLAIIALYALFVLTFSNSLPLSIFLLTLCTIPLLAAIPTAKSKK